MNSVIVAVMFGFAAVLAVSEVSARRTRHRVVRRARQQVGLLELEDQAGAPTRNGPTLRVVGGGVLLGIAGIAVAGPIGLVAGFLPAVAVRSWDKRRIRKRRELLADQLAPSLQLIIGHLRIGRNIVSAMAEVAEDTPSPLGDLLHEIVSEVRLGASVDEVLAKVADREDDRHLNVIASAIGLQSRHGGSLVEILDTVVETIEEEDRLRRDIRSLTADGRLSAQVLLAMPIAMLVIVSLLSPGYATPLVEHPTGRAMSIAGIVLGLAGWRWLRSITSPKVIA